MRRNTSLQVFLGFLVSFLGLVHHLQAGIIVTTVDMVARQQVNLFGVQDTLVSRGLITFTFDVDANNNTVVGGASSVAGTFTGTLPAGFSVLGLEDAPFELFTLPGTLTATNNGTHVSALLNFGLRVYAAPNVVLANFYTSTPSLFESDVISLTNFTGSVFQDPVLRPNDFTQVFIGDNLLNVPVDSLVGFSFDRTVTAVPEPSSLMMCSLLGLALVVYKKRRR
jgi:hypothetical protein